MALLDAVWQSFVDLARIMTLGCREIMMGVGNRVASVIMLTFLSEPCPHADFSK